MKTLNLNFDIPNSELKSAAIVFNDAEKFGDVNIGTAGKKTVILDITGNFYNAQSSAQKANVFINDNPSFGGQSANDYFQTPDIAAVSQKNLIMRSIHDTDNLPAEESGSYALRGGQQQWIKSYFRGIVTNGVTKVQINNVDSIGQGIVRYYEI